MSENNNTEKDQKDKNTNGIYRKLRAIKWKITTWCRWRDRRLRGLKNKIVNWCKWKYRKLRSFKWKVTSWCRWKYRKLKVNIRKRLRSAKWELTIHEMSPPLAAYDLQQASSSSCFQENAKTKS